jgi:hypothetical protein
MLVEIQNVSRISFLCVILHLNYQKHSAFLNNLSKYAEKNLKKFKNQTFVRQPNKDFY